MIKPVEKAPVHEIVYNSILNLIEDGSWNAGDRIPGEMDLSAEFNVSRNSLRTALKVLESDGILVCKPGVGTFVTEDALQEIRSRKLVSMLQDASYSKEIVEARAILDKEIAYQAALKATEDDVSRLEECIDSLDKAYKELDEENIVFWGSRFHEVIAEINGNRILLSIYRSLHTVMDHDRLWYLHKRGAQKVFSDFISHDRKIIEAFRNRDGELARQLMVEHMEIRSRGLEEIIHNET